MPSIQTRHQFFRFAIVGTVSNALLFLMYLVLTEFGVGHKLAMSILYIVGVMQTFVFNKRWSFKHSGAMRITLLRYWIVYVTGYILNLVALQIFVDEIGLPHQVVQGAMILLLAILLFVTQKFWVFRVP